MRDWFMYTLGVVALVAITAAVSTLVDAPLSALVLAVPVLAAALGAKWLSNRRRARSRADQVDSIESENAQQAAAQTLPVMLVLLVALGAWLVIDESFGAAALVYATAAASTLVYAVAYARLRRRS